MPRMPKGECNLFKMKTGNMFVLCLVCYFSEKQSGAISDVNSSMEELISMARKNKAVLKSHMQNKIKYKIKKIKGTLPSLPFLLV